MVQNTSHAVMQQRHEAHDSLDYFPTPPWATRALCEWLLQYDMLGCMTALEPACGAGDMSLPLKEYFLQVESSDINPLDFGYQRDFLFGDAPPTDWTITNPPFRLAEQFVAQGLRCSKHGVAMLVRTSFLEGASRYRGLFEPHPPTDILQFVERVPMFKGRLDPKGSTATSYCWVVWQKYNQTGTRFHWLSPCRKKLERAGDYDR